MNAPLGRPGKPAAPTLSERHSTALQVIAYASRIFEVSHSQLIGRDRSADVFQARAAAIHVARRLTGLSYPALGEVFGDRDHTTVLYAESQIEVLKQRSPRFQRRLNRLMDIAEALACQAGVISMADDSPEQAFADLAIAFAKARRLDAGRAADLIAALVIAIPAHDSATESSTK